MPGTYINPAETGFYLTGTRYYDPEVGRFINADTISVLTASPMSLTEKNLFAYCDNNPITRVDYTGALWDTVFDVGSLCVSVVDVVRNPDDAWAWFGLLGDVIDLIPFVIGVGEAIKAYKAYKRADMVMDATTEVVDTAIDVKRGWKVGDDITNLTKAENEPSWSTIRQRYWKNEAYYNSVDYLPEDLFRMRKGLAPIAVDNFSMELHHPYGRYGSNIFEFYPVSKTEHIEIHRNR